MENQNSINNTNNEYYLDKLRDIIYILGLLDELPAIKNLYMIYKNQENLANLANQENQYISIVQIPDETIIKLNNNLFTKSINKSKLLQDKSSFISIDSFKPILDNLREYNINNIKILDFVINDKISLYAVINTFILISYYLLNKINNHESLLLENVTNIDGVINFLLYHLYKIAEKNYRYDDELNKFDDQKFQELLNKNEELKNGLEFLKEFKIKYHKIDTNTKWKDETTWEDPDFKWLFENLKKEENIYKYLSINAHRRYLNYKTDDHSEEYYKKIYNNPPEKTSKLSKLLNNKNKDIKDHSQFTHLRLLKFIGHFYNYLYYKIYNKFYFNNKEAIIHPINEFGNRIEKMYENELPPPPYSTGGRKHKKQRKLTKKIRKSRKHKNNRKHKNSRKHKKTKCSRRTKKH